MGRLMRILTPILACTLALAAAGRFHAEASVREARGELREARQALGAEAEAESRLRLEVEVLESAHRFEEVNARTLQLAAPEPEQLTTGDAFASRIGRDTGGRAAPSDTDLIGSAIKMTAPEASHRAAGTSKP